MKTTTIKLTDLETRVLRELFYSSRGNGHEFGFTEEHGLEDKRKAGGVIASLERKGILESLPKETTFHSGRSFTQFVWTLGGTGPEANLAEIARLAGVGLEGTEEKDRDIEVADLQRELAKVTAERDAALVKLQSIRRILEVDRG